MVLRFASYDAVFCGISACNMMQITCRHASYCTGLCCKTWKKGKHLCTFPKAKIMNFRGECKSNVKINNKSPHCLELLHAVLSALKSMAVDFWNVACCMLIRDLVIGCSIGRKMLHAMLLSACCIGNHRLAIDRTSSGKGEKKTVFLLFLPRFFLFIQKYTYFCPCLHCAMWAVSGLPAYGQDLKKKIGKRWKGTNEI